MRAYLYYSNNQPLIVAGEHAFRDKENLYEGDALLIHLGNGHFHRFICAAVDNESALLVASNF